MLLSWYSRAYIQFRMHCRVPVSEYIAGYQSEFVGDFCELSDLTFSILWINSADDKLDYIPLPEVVRHFMQNDFLGNT